MARLSFDDLPLDLKTLIVEKILHPSDLVRVCKVNKQFHELAVKLLYHSIRLDLGRPSDTHLSAFLSPQNIGLKHIKHLRITVNNARSKPSDMQQAHIICKMILEMLPQDILEKFSWCPWHALPTDSLLLLYQRQRKLRWLEVVEIDRNILPTIQQDEKLRKDIFSHARQLALYPGDKESLELSGFYMRNMKDVLEELIIHADFDNDLREHSPDERGVQNSELNDSATRPGLLTRTIFNSFLPFDKCAPLPNLRCLRLQDVNVRFCADTWCKVLPFRNIEELSIHGCTGADSLLSQMCKASDLPQQLYSLELIHKDNRQNETLLALDGFLCLVSGITELFVDVCNARALPAVAGIIRHNKTLRELNIHCRSMNRLSRLEDVVPPPSFELVWDREDFENICKSCCFIEELSCAWPSTELMNASSPWTAFLNSCNRLRNLVTLQITTFPTIKSTSTGGTKSTLDKAIYERLLQCVAQHAFTSIYQTVGETFDVETGEPLNEDDIRRQPGRLRLIAFGTNTKANEREDDPKHQLIYLRSTCEDAEGRQQIYAAPIGWGLRHYVEPRSTVLDVPLSSTAGVAVPYNDTPRNNALGWAGNNDAVYAIDPLMGMDLS